MYGILTTKCYLIIMCSFALIIALRSSANADASDKKFLSNLYKSHPRIMLTQSDIQRIRNMVKSDSIAAGYLKGIREHGEDILKENPAERVLVGPRLLFVSRLVLNRVMALGFLYRIDNDPKWSARAIKEMRAAAEFVDWNPSHFLDVAEMTNALAIGYDWLYDAMSPEDRALIKNAIVKKGLEPALAVYQKGEWWAKSPYNWNNVCNGGEIVGALAIADEEPALCEQIISYALKSLPLAMATYAPDGAWCEGAGYWEYATQYTLYAVSALHSALGTDMGLMNYKGVSETGYYPYNMFGPTGKLFNFADAPEIINMRTCLYGLARWYKNPSYAYIARKAPQTEGIRPFDLIWYDPSGTEKDIASIPLDTFYPNVGLAMFRSSRNDSNAFYVGFKAGSNAAGHAHLDLGSFIFEADGVRWVDDIGRDEYNLPGYFDKVKRWTHYRLSTAGHNTITFDGANQDTKAAAPITKFVTEKDHGFAITDLTQAYAQNGARKVTRGIALQDSRSKVLVQDEIEADESAKIVWAIHTSAEVNIDPSGTNAVLTLNGKTMHVYILNPAGAKFTLEEIKLDKPHIPLREKKLLLKMQDKAEMKRIAVLFSQEKVSKLPELTTLDMWK